MPGVGFAAKTPEAALNLIREAIVFSIEGLQLQGWPISQPSARSEYAEVSVEV